MISTATPVQPPRSTVHIKQLQQASRRLLVVPRDAERRRYVVASAADPAIHYEVALQPGELAGHCTCAWSRHGGINCKHVLAALRASYAPRGALSFWASPGEARRQHRQVLPGERIYATLRPRGRR